MSEIRGSIGTGATSGADGDIVTAVRLPDAMGARWFRRQLVAGVGVVTTLVGSGFRGATVTGYTSLSLEPALLLVSLDEESQMAGWLDTSGVFALNLLPWQEQFLADQFAGFTPLADVRLAGINYTPGLTGSPILRSARAWAECAVEQSLTTGDHRSFIGRILALGAADGDVDDPLLHFLSGYRRLR